MFRTIALTLGLAVAASAVAAEEFAVLVNNIGNEAGATTVDTSVTTSSVAADGVFPTELSPELAATLDTVRGDAPGYLEVTPFR
jgi:hypothetical protein